MYKIYGIIYWTNNDNEVHFVKRDDAKGAVWVSLNVEEADKKAYEVEDKWNVDCRVISLEGILE